MKTNAERQKAFRERQKAKKLEAANKEIAAASTRSPEVLTPFDVLKRRMARESK